MANNYCDSSSFVSIPADKLKQAEEIAASVAVELDYDDGGVGYTAEFRPDGVWIHHDESVNCEHMERLVKALVESLDLEGVFVCSWAYTCSSPRINEFGGGAFAVQKGKDTIWIDAVTEAKKQALDLF
jgi:hypothetical protein